MENEELKKRLEEQGLKIDAIYKSVEKTRKYFLAMIWITVIGVGLPILGLAFAIPAFMNNYVNTLGGLDTNSAASITDILNSVN
jgi:hypothetical protein